MCNTRRVRAQSTIAIAFVHFVHEQSTRLYLCVCVMAVMGCLFETTLAKYENIFNKLGILWMNAIEIETCVAKQ